MSESVAPARLFDRAFALASAFYLVLAVVLTWPLTAQLSTAVPNDLGDPLLNAWLLWWNAQTVPLTAAWWDSPAFFPAEATLTFSEHLAGISPLSTPLYWLSGNAQFAYNATFLLTFPLSAIAAYLLCLDLTGRRDAALLGGLIYGFAPYRVAQMAHLQVMASYFMPLALLGLHRYIRAGGTRWLVLFAGSWLLQGLCNGYYLAYFTLLIVAWALWFVPLRSWRTWLSIGLAGAVAAIPLLPVVFTYRSIHDMYGFERSLNEIESFSADVTAVLDPAPLLAVWSDLSVYHRAEGELFPGLCAVLLIVLGLWLSRDRLPPEAAGRRRLRRTLVFGVLLFGGVAVSAAIAPWQVDLLGVSISSRNPEKPLTVAAICAAALLFASRPTMMALQTRASLAFYVLAAFVIWVLTLGPSPTFLGEQVFYQAPYRWLLQLPGFDTLRVPSRFAMIMMLCLAAAAALAFCRIAPRSRPVRHRALLAAGFAVIAIADVWITRMPLHQPPPIWDVGPDEIDRALLVLPLGVPDEDVRVMYQSMGHGRPLVNGYSGNFAPWYTALRRGLNIYEPEMLDELARLGVSQILVPTDLDRDGAWRQYASSRATFVRMAADGSYHLYDLLSVETATERPVGSEVPIAAISTNVNQDRLSALRDGDTTTRWDSGPQSGGEQLTIDLGSIRPVGGVRTSLGPFSGDYPRQLLIETSADGAEWIEVWRGRSEALTFTATVRQPVEVPVIYELGERSARFIRLTQLEHDGVYYWSIGELAVLTDRP